MSTRIALTGQRVTTPVPDECGRLFREDLRYEVLDEVRTGRSRDDLSQADLDAEPDDILEMRDADGLVTFRRVSSLLDEEGRASLSADPAVYLTAAAARDGLASVESVRLVRVALPEEVAAAVDEVHRVLGDAPADRVLAGAVDLAARPAMTRVVDWLDRPAAPDDPFWGDKPKTRGVYRVGPDLRLPTRGPVAGDELGPSAEPWLLLVHGTCAHTEATFGGLRGGEFATFARRYEDRLLAFEHATLGMTPAQNAREVASVLPEGAKLHLLTHGRGGLVGDVLALAGTPGAWPGTDRYVAAGQGDHPDVAALDEVRRLVAAKGIRVARFARVAAPGKGTWLVSRRLDVWAKYVLQAHRAASALRESAGAALVEKLVLTVLDKHTDPRLVPGMEAMLPESTFVRWLNTAPPIDDGMAVIAGDVRGGVLIERLAAAGADSFHREDNDLVVHTRSMFGGVPRRDLRAASVEGPDAVHTNYFGRADSRRAVLAWLAATGPDVAGFASPGGAPVAARPRGGPRGATGLVVLVPDVFGSVLTSPHGRVWPSVTALLGDVREILAPGGTFTAEALTGAYDALIEGLTTRYEVRPIGYDWTAPSDRTVAALREELRAALRGRTAGGPVHVVAVGAGGLYVVAALQEASDVLESVRESKGRLVLLSPPVHGSWRIAATLKGRDELTARLALLAPNRTAADVGAALAGLPGLAELLPEGAPFDDSTLERARAFRRRLPEAFPATVVYGSTTETVDGWSPDREAFTTSPAGDGHVCVATPAFKAPTFWAPMSHADLISRPDGVSHLLRVLEEGRSEGLRLSVPPPSARARGILKSVEHRVDFPSDVDLVSVPGGLVRRAARIPGRPVRISVIHGDITHVEAPILVGTYDGTPIRGALHTLDRRFGGALSARAALGQLPGPLGTSDIITTPHGPGTAVVIGIGDPGDLTPGQLTAGVTDGLLKLILAQQERGVIEEGRGITVAAALIGTFGGGALTVQASVSAITRGVHHVNRRLLDVGEKVDEAWVESLQIVELFEDRAIEATEAAIRLARERQPEGAVLAAEHFLIDGCGGKPGLPPPDYSSGLWRTIRIGAAAEEKKNSVDELVALSFTSVGRSARAEQRVNRAQRRLVDQLVDEGIDQPRTDRQLYNTLFELLLPTSMKGQGPATENLMLVVDPAASTIPFELLAARGLEETPVPLAVETGMMRRLETTTFRESVRPAAGLHALVIGDPSGVAQRLPGAREEARRVAAKLSQHGFQVTAVIPESETDMSADVTRIMNALFRHDYRIIHIAAHGTYASESDNGILIGKDILLSAQEIRQMRATPDLVFLNACHAGSILLRRRAAGQGDQEPPTNAAGRLAASISRQLIDDGVRGVVAAGWAVDDDAAASFAETFYDGLLGRLDLGDATRQARAAIYHAFPAVNTWGAYQVYGPPAMRIHVAGTGSADGPDVVSRKQFRSRLADLQSRADDATDDQQADIESALRQALGSVPQEWMGGSELYAEADVWFRLGNYEKAIGRYTDALREWEGKAPLKLVEQLVNAKVKQAQQDPGRTDLFDEAASLIEALRLLGAETPERRALEGSYLRRRAAASPPELRPALLEQARTAYRAADQMYQAKHGRSGFYFGLNWVLLDWLLTRREEPDVPTLLRIIESCEQDAAAQACADFWCRTTAADAALARALVTDSLAGERTAIAEAYLKVFRSGSSRRERMAITEHIRILRSFLDEDGTIAAALEDIEATLSAPLGAAREPSRG